MTDYEVCGHPVSIEFTEVDFHRFWQAARNTIESSKGAKTQAGLHAVMPGLLERISAQLPTLTERAGR